MLLTNLLTQAPLRRCVYMQVLTARRETAAVLVVASAAKAERLELGCLECQQTVVGRWFRALCFSWLG